MNGLEPLAEWVVPPNEIDTLGHMSTTQYARRVLAGWARILGDLGATQDALAGAGLVAAPVDQHVLYRREQVAGARLSLAGAVVAAGGTRIEVYQEFANTGSGDLAAMYRSTIELQDRGGRTPVALPAPWLEAARSRAIGARAPPAAQPDAGAHGAP